MSTKPLVLDDFYEYAKKTLPKAVFDYYEVGAMDNQTHHDNRFAFSRYRLRSRVLIPVERLVTRISLFGMELSSPICIAPTAMQKMAHAEGELATAKATASFGSIVCLSSFSTTCLEDIIQVCPLSFFQLYVLRDRHRTRQLIHRVEKAGYKALVITVDTPYLGKRTENIRNKFTLPANLTLANFQEHLKSSSQMQANANAYELLSSVQDANLCWDDIKEFKKWTKLPVVLKGIMTREDALLAVECGIDGIIVSNHGGRQLDGVPATIDVLGDIASAVGNRIPICIDGGIRCGADVFKAIALGATCVFVGRPALWALAYNGSDGVLDMLTILQNELKLTMALCGCPSIHKITADHIIHERKYKL